MVAMKPLILTLAAVPLLLQAGCAADGYRHQHRELSTDELATELNLTGVQRQQFEQIVDSERTEREQLRQSSGQMSRGSRREQMGALQSEMLQKLGTVLTPPQLRKFEQLEQPRWHRGRWSGSYGQGPSE